MKKKKIETEKIEQKSDDSEKNIGLSVPQLNRNQIISLKEPLNDDILDNCIEEVPKKNLIFFFFSFFKIIKVEHNTSSLLQTWMRTKEFSDAVRETRCSDGINLIFNFF